MVRCYHGIAGSRTAVIPFLVRIYDNLFCIFLRANILYFVDGSELVMGGRDEANKRIFFKSICDLDNFCHHIFFGLSLVDAGIKKTKNIQTDHP